MKYEFQAIFRVSSSERSWRVWVGSRIAALIIGAALVLALFASRPAILPLEEQVIQSITAATLDKERAMPLPPPTTIVQSEPQPKPQPKPQQERQAQPEPPKSGAAKAPPRQAPIIAAPKLISPRQQLPSKAPTKAGPFVAAPPGSGSSYQPPRIATAPSSQGVTGAAAGRAAGGDPGGGESPLGQLGARTMGILRARECARLDIRDRPADCPPNDELLALLAKERGPQYRPENAEGFSRNEQRWRGVPPPCLADGVNSRLNGAGACVRFGNVPSRVRTVREICEAKGLGGCAPTPSQAAINAALEQVRRQEAAKAAKAP